MLLPNHPAAVIDESKLVDYLLNAAHPDNGGKAAFFAGWGFAPADWRVLERAIRGMISRADVARVVPSPWGVKYVVDGPLASPHGQTPPVRTVWVIAAAATDPRLVTAYPV